MTRFRQLQPRRSSGARPNRGWTQNVATAFTTVPAASKVLLGTFSGQTGIDLTILRTVGMVAVATDAVTATEAQIGGFGMIIVSDQAVAAGIASIPGAVTDADDDGWFIHMTFAQLWQSGDATGRGFQTLPYQFDSKAKRIIQENQSIAIVVENISASAGLLIADTSRILTQVRGTG